MGRVDAANVRVDGASEGGRCECEGGCSRRWM